MGRKTALASDAVFVMVASIVIATSLIAIAGMLLAAAAFSSGANITIPLIASFDGTRAAAESPTVTVNASWVSGAVLTLILALPLSLFALQSRRRRV